ncbi:hypothetical protein CLV24_1411 [Pontibacter ummariensis]|uniref:Cytochrome C and Quinol oxidase polypeptide I n=1 Tax=Pontibacter ummariensis TaxID=1610492 RepID=A0A239LGA8_9BACT|nr:hypothetical protein CLV24_1411 [Pontibacter ummariensis]SNT29395.1 hypothetical protein SAMN06296052_14125 [Pontibacter ummariensis]
MFFKRDWLLVALLNLVVLALMGLLLRWLFVAPVEEMNYKFLLHGHSHVALLGWLYTAFFVALLYTFFPVEVRRKKVYAWQFWLAQGAVLGMLLTFPVQGYAAASITFTTAHMLLTYWFIYQFLKDAKALQLQAGRHTLSFRFVKAALFFMGLSTLGPWSLGPIMATGHSGSELYLNAIYFYLHFQYNGWFTFAVLGLLFWLLEQYKLGFNARLGPRFFRLMFWSCIPAFLLSVLWATPPAFVYALGGTAALVQLFAFGLLLQCLWPVRRQLLGLFGRWSRWLLLLAALAFSLKTLMQAATAVPYMADLAYRLRIFVIGYLHLVLIGFISLFLLAFFAQQGWLSFKSRMSQWGISLFLAGFICSEAVLFLQGVFFWLGFGVIPAYNQLLFGISTLLPLGILLFFVSQLRGEGATTEHLKQVPLQQQKA